MPILRLDINGFLPPGIHNSTLPEIHELFGTFRGSDHRSRLFHKLQAFVAEVKSAGLVHAIVVDGSFVTAKSVPNDIDLLLILPQGHDFAADLPVPAYNVVDRSWVKRRYGFDMFVVEDGSLEYSAMVRFFQRVPLQPVNSRAFLG